MISNTHKKIHKHLIAGIAFAASFFILIPALVFAIPTDNPSGQTTTGYCANVNPSLTLMSSGDKIGTVLQNVTCLIEGSIIPLLFAAALMVFIWGVVKFIGTEDSTEREQGKQFMLWGIIAIAVMFSIWGLVKVLGDTFGVHTFIPQLPTDTGVH